MLIPRSPLSSYPTQDDLQLLDKSYLLTPSTDKKQPRILQADTPSDKLWWPEDGLKAKVGDAPQSHWPSTSMPPAFLSSPTSFQFVEPLGRTSCASKPRQSSLPLFGSVSSFEDTTHSFADPSSPSPSPRSRKKRSSSYSDDDRFQYDLMLPIPVRQISPKRRRLSVRQPYGGPRACTQIRSPFSPDSLSECSESATFVNETPSSNPEASQRNSSSIPSSHSGTIPTILSNSPSSISFPEYKETKIQNIPFHPDLSSVSLLKTFIEPEISNILPATCKIVSKKTMASKKSRLTAPRHSRRFKLSSLKTNSECYQSKIKRPTAAFLAKLCNQLRPRKKDPSTSVISRNLVS